MAQKVLEDRADDIPIVPIITEEDEESPRSESPRNEELEREIRELKERESEQVLFLQTMYQERDIIDEEMRKLQERRDQIERVILESEDARMDVERSLQKKVALLENRGEERARYKRTKDEYQQKYLEITEVLVDNYVKHNSMRLLSVRDARSEARTDLDKKLAELGYDMWRKDDFTEWRKNPRNERRILLEDVVKSLKARYPTLLDYGKLELMIRNQKEDITMSEQWKSITQLFTRNYMKKFEIPTESESRSVIERKMTEVGLSRHRMGTLSEVVSEFKTRFPLLLSYGEFSF